MVAAATVLTAAVERLEGGMATGHAGDAAFAAALEAVFFYTGALLGALMLASTLRRRLWFATP